MHITGIYVALATLLVLVLAGRVSTGRRTHKLSLGDGGHADMVARIRAHANALENLPLALLLLLMLELNQTHPLWLHVFGCLLIVARIAHAIGMSGARSMGVGRLIGTVATWLLMGVMALLLLWQWFAWTATSL
ncbi:MAG: MAPEG family protein [Dokdonella sp.]|uniref:MAPEG family protein n=1 Tax=Dokdonella sp. TaxID=2291710 RepID=UPI003267DBB1